MEIKSENLKQRLHIASIFGFVLGTLYILVFNFEIHEKNENEPSDKIYHLGFKTGYAGK